MARKYGKKKKKEAKKLEVKKIKIPIKLTTKLATKKILYPAIVLILILGCVLFLKKSPYFVLENIEVYDPARATELSSQNLTRLYKGRNIFDVDIRAISSQIKDEYPVIKGAIIKRVLPNKIEVDIIARIPVAKIKTHEYFPVDRTGMVLSPRTKSSKIPIVIGFSRWTRPKVGTKLKSPQLESAFSLIDELDEKRGTLSFSVETIDVSNYRNLSFYTESGIEVKIGGEDFPARLKKLQKTFDSPKMDRSNIKYIDLRFRDVVIGPK